MCRWNGVISTLKSRIEIRINMAFDQEWEKIFQSRNWGKYPSENLVRPVLSTYEKIADRKLIRCLDLGCGGGANTWFLSREGFDTYAIDGSPTAIEQTNELLKSQNLTCRSQVGDFVRLDYANETFDFVVDMDAVQHNRWTDIKLIHSEIYRVLKPGGYIFGMSLNQETTGWETSQQLEPGTFKKFIKGFIQIDVTVHLFSKEELQEILKPYENVTIDRVLLTKDNGKESISHFIFRAQKQGLK